MIRSKVDQVKVMDEAINGLLPTIYQDIIEKDGVKPYAQPKVDVTKLSDTELDSDKGVFFSAFSNLNGEEASVNDDEVKAAIDALLKNNATLASKLSATEADISEKLSSMLDGEDSLIADIETKLGVTTIFQYGPICPDLQILEKSVNCSFKRINYQKQNQPYILVLQC